jgi:predicted amidophosphoribosyltransferase
MRDRHPCCRSCRMRFAPPAATRPTCPRCGGPLSSLAPVEAIGHPLSAPVSLQWRPADLDALARAVANVGASIQQ